MGVSRKMCGKAGIKTLKAEGNSKGREVSAAPAATIQDLSEGQTHSKGKEVL